ncbi:hypothetical protein B0H94_11131 [Salsuginibacillus halophilus]|uniref:Uncharacterized protein n=1 Tax=Salsuginibacillus halophilus TaxID=517424 RepID=A0A2P8HAF7_9BACI|nr:hypothetical protein [Salsuginibacillus halophilus]PSL43208.1 hypothetical protein B0H94_11131 [Salsuginibacillus halophilus]
MSTPIKNPKRFNLDNPNELKAFKKWAESSDKNNSPQMKKTREEMKKARAARKQGRFYY